MDDEEEYELEYDEEEAVHPVRRFRKGDLLVVALETAYGLSSVATNSLAMLRNLAGMHMNYAVEQDRFHREAMLAIETITGEQDG